MAGINDYSNTAGSNTTINGIDIAEGCSPAGINNAIRQLMADIADMDDGVVPLQTPDINGGTIDGATIGGSSTIDNSIIGGTTPAAGTFTNLTATGTLTGLLGNVVEDVTPQLGGDLDLNSNDITGTGNINITGTATVSGDLTVDTNTLKVDSSNNVVMVGLTSSLISNDAKLQVAHTNGNADIIVHRAGDNANPPSLNFQKTRNASIGNYGTIVQNNDELGSIRWGGADGSNIGFAARIVGAVDGTPGANDMPGRLQFHTSPDGTENLTERMRIDSSGNVGIGTSSPATKTHIFNGSDNANILFIQGADTTTENIFFGVETGKSTITAGGSSSTNNSLVFRASNAGAETEYMRITNTGNVGIGTSSPTSGGGLTLSSSTTAQGFIDFKHTVDGDSGYIGNAKALITGATTNQLGVRGGTNGIAFGVGATEAMRIDSSGNVGIGNIPETWYSTFSALQIGANKSAIYGRSENNQLSLASNSYVNTSGNNTYINSSEASLYEQNTGMHKFFTAPSGTAGNSITFTERMRIDSSGKVLVGKTASGDTVGAEIWPVGYIALKRASTMLNLNRTSDGSLVNFQKSSVDIGSIGSAASTDLYVASGDTGFRIVAANDNLRPCTSTGGNRDNAMDLGEAAVRFDDIFATNGTIQTSDQNEKQSIQALTSSEIVVAQRISKLFKTFKFNSAVEEKGDSARTHTGVIAQDVQQAFTDEGLDAGNYALFISDTWWEKEIFVDAVEAQDAIYETQTDEEGNETQVLVQEAVEAKDAYSHIDVVYEATEGYTQRTRLGIRYPELLSFVSSAFEQRLTNIETRLRALET